MYILMPRSQNGSNQTAAYIVNDPAFYSTIPSPGVDDRHR